MIYNCTAPQYLPIEPHRAAPRGSPTLASNIIFEVCVNRLAQCDLLCVTVMLSVFRRLTCRT